MTGGIRLYEGSSDDFISDAVHDRIADKLRAAYSAAYRGEAPRSEVQSWRNSLQALSAVLEQGSFKRHGVLLEYELPLTSKRLDCLLTGKSAAGSYEATIIELKQWERCQQGDAEGVVTFVGGGSRDVLHPAVQVGQYRNYLGDYQPVFYEDKEPIGLRACAYLHNYSPTPDDALFADQYQSFLSQCPVFTLNQVGRVTHFLRENLATGDDQHALRKILETAFRPSKKLLQHVGRLLEGRPEYVLLDEQLVAFERVLAVARRARTKEKKTVVIIRGGPGTGKSVIALNLLARLSAEELNAHYVTGSRAFTETLKRVVGARAQEQVKNFSSYMYADANFVDVMVCDEAHRMWEKSRSRQHKSTGKLQIEELIHASRATIFFIDDRQAVRPDEIGTAEYVKCYANASGCDVFDYKLQAQFRCAGSAGFVNWIENTLDIEKTASILWNPDDEFDFCIVSSPGALDEIIRSKVGAGFTARIIAGFCWPWSDPLRDGNLVEDVVVDGLHRAWNAKPGAGHIKRGIPKASLWAYDPRGIDQIGCVYTAQGFEFDYVGVIFGPDLVYRPGVGWIGQREHSFDGVVKRSRGNFEALIKNTYRVLFSRAMKGCYVYFMDKATETFFRSRMDFSVPIEGDMLKAAESPPA